MTRLIAIPKRRRNSTANNTKSLFHFVLLIFVLLLPSGPLSRFEIIPAVQASESDRHTFPLPFVPFVESNIVENEHALESLLGQINDFVQHAVSYLVRISHSPQQDPKFPGRFTYRADTRVSLDPSLERNYWSRNQQPEYHLLRHIGTTYALAQAYRRSKEHPKQLTENHYVTQTALWKTLEASIGYLRDNALLPVPGHKEEWLAAWERTNPEDPNSEPDVARLGGAALALIVMGQMEGIKPQSVSLEKELRKLASFIESMQNEETGEFTSKYQWRKGPYHDWVSLYYPGEAALAMVTLAELELTMEKEEEHKMVTSTDLELEHQQHHSTPTKELHSQRWIKVATNALLYLERFRRDLDLEEIEPDHWALLATSRLLPILDQQRNDKALAIRDQKQADLEYSLIYSHGVRVAHSIVARHTTKGLEQHQGCFTYDGRTHATATRLEGLFAAMSFVKDTELFFGDEEEDEATELLKDRMEKDVAAGIKFLFQAQVKSDFHNMRGAVPARFTRKKLSPPPNDDEHEEDEDLEFAEVRIDYVQHSLSAVMAYERFLLRKKEDYRNSQAFHKRVNEHVRKAVNHAKHRIHKAASSSVFVNYAILATVGVFVILVIGLAYLPWSWIPILGGRSKRRKRKNKRND